MSSTKKICSGQFVRKVYFLRYPNRISKSLQPFKNKLTPTVKVAYVLCAKNRKVTLTKSKRTGTRNIEHNILKASVFFKAF